MAVNRVRWQLNCSVAPSCLFGSILWSTRASWARNKVSHSGNTWTFDFLSLYVENQLYQEAHSSGVGCSTASKILNPGKNWIGFYCLIAVIVWLYSQRRSCAAPWEPLETQSICVCCCVWGWPKAASNNITLHCSKGVKEIVQSSKYIEIHTKPWFLPTFLSANFPL